MTINADDASSITESFFDFFDTYIELQYAIELCKPYFFMENGKRLVDDLLRMAMEYGLLGEQIMNDNPEILTDYPVLDLMAQKISELADRISAISWGDSVYEPGSGLSNEFTDYVLSALISSEAPVHKADASDREWYSVTSRDFRTLVMRNRETREYNGAFLQWAGDRLTKIYYYDHDVPIFQLNVYNDGIVEAASHQPPVKVEITDSEYGDDKNARSDTTWGAVVAGTVGGLFLASLIKTRKSTTDHGVHDLVQSEKTR